MPQNKSQNNANDDSDYPTPYYIGSVPASTNPPRIDLIRKVRHRKNLTKHGPRPNPEAHLESAARASSGFVLGGTSGGPCEPRLPFSPTTPSYAFPDDHQATSSVSTGAPIGDTYPGQCRLEKVWRMPHCGSLQVWCLLGGTRGRCATTGAWLVQETSPTAEAEETRLRDIGLWAASWLACRFAGPTSRLSCNIVGEKASHCTAASGCTWSQLGLSPSPQGPW